MSVFCAPPTNSVVEVKQLKVSSVIEVKTANGNLYLVTFTLPNYDNVLIINYDNVLIINFEQT